MKTSRIKPMLLVGVVALGGTIAATQRHWLERIPLPEGLAAWPHKITLPHDLWPKDLAWPETLSRPGKHPSAPQPPVETAHEEPKTGENAIASKIPAPPEAPPLETGEVEPMSAIAALEPPPPPPTPEIPEKLRSAVKAALQAYRAGDMAAGDAVVANTDDPAARTLMRWLAIRTSPKVGFDRIATFLAKHPDFPTRKALRRRGEDALYAEMRTAREGRLNKSVKSYFASEPPTLASGKIALATVLMGEGDKARATALVRDAWREDNFNDAFEKAILERFPDVLTREDHRYRMERFLFNENWSKATRAAALAGPDYAALTKARIAVASKAKDAAKLLDAVPAALKSDTSYLFSRAQFLRRQDKTEEAAKLLEKLSRDPAVLVDGDEWWVERRMITRKLLDENNPKLAYEVAKNHGGESPAMKIEAEFHAGWIALRFLHDAKAASEHFANAARIAETPISVSRAQYWQGRAAEAAGNADRAHAFYVNAANQPFTYYGQLARAKLDLDDMPLRTVERSESDRKAFESREDIKAIRMLYAIDERDLAMALITDLAQRLDDPQDLDGLGELVAATRDARALLAVGKTAVQRGLPLDRHAFPTTGIPAFDPVPNPVEKAMVFAIARQESSFDPKAVSPAGARGLMQLMPATARVTATRFKLPYDADRLTEDPAYNATIGAAHLSDLVSAWRGSYILTFAAYNAGGGNVKKWIDTYGDPRKPGVDIVDWIERIPFTETRNYVQRVMENLQVYRTRLDAKQALLIEKDLRRGRLPGSAPALVAQPPAGKTTLPPGASAFTEAESTRTP